jgi:sugar transferase (PEP-CTERM/EpsH1 system associated)
MRILFLTPQLPYPPQKGTALRNWGLIQGLAERHELSLLSFREPGKATDLDATLTSACKRVVTVPQPERSLYRRVRDMVSTRQPDMALRLASGSYDRQLRDWLAEDTFDVVQIEGIELAPYLDTIRSAPQDPLVVFDDHNCEYLLQQRTFLTDLYSPAHWPGAAYSFVQWQRLRRYEARICRRADHVLAVSEADAEALSRLAPDLNVTVVPNGIDTQAYRPATAGADRPENTLVFTGTMDFRPNVDAVVWFAGEVLPLIRAQVPDVRFLVVGQRPHRRLDGLRRNPAITLTGWVEDVRPYFADATVYVAPLRMGGGTRLKLLEAMAMQKPIVATSLGAEGYPVRNGRELILADTPAAFAGAVTSLLDGEERRAELGRTARAFVEAHYDWRAIVPHVEAVYGAQAPGK